MGKGYPQTWAPTNLNDSSVILAKIFIFGLLHLWRFRLVLSIEEFWQGPPLNGVNGIVVEPGRVAGYDDVMGLLSHVVLILFLSLGVIVCSFLIPSILTNQLSDKTIENCTSFWT